MSHAAVDPRDRLDHYYHLIQTVILSRQNPISGLLPASTAVNAHGDYTDAWVRDNVYSILAVWGLGLAYRKVEDSQGRAYELEHSVVKLMRGLLFAMMRQAAKVEKFKQTQAPLDSLHAKYDTATGDTVVRDDGWGHLQLDATSIFLLMLAQMTTSGLSIIYTLDEVNFVQNLVYYIGRAYRTPDYGIWERGNKINHGSPELNASSVGMAKAALEAINGLDLFGVRGSQASVIHVLPDEIARSRVTLESLLPRESSSKEVDAALLSVISFPAFAVEDPQLVDRTRRKIIDKLQGRYGCKRFLRDGHQTVIEDNSRLHYEPHELRQFEHIECEWPLFFTYLWLDGLFRQDIAQAEEYQQRLQSVLVQRGEVGLLPELYYVPSDRIEAERADPHSQDRQPNENIPLIWAQSLYYLGQLLSEGLLAVGDIDPLGRYLRPGQQRDVVVQIALLSEDEVLQAQLETYGIPSQTPSQIAPIQVRKASELAIAYTQVGRNDKLKLSGRPNRRLRSLTTSRIFQLRGSVMVFLPSFLDQRQFYLSFDARFLVAQIKSELAYIQRNWMLLGRPTMTLLLTHTLLGKAGEDLDAHAPFLELVQELQSGWCNGVPVKVGRMNQLLLTASRERVNFLHDFEFTQAPVQEAKPECSFLTANPDHNAMLGGTQEFALEQETNLSVLVERLRHSDNLYEQIEILQSLARLKDLNFDTGLGQSWQRVTVRDLIEEVYVRAGEGDGQGRPYWGVVRRAAGLLNKVDITLTEAVTDILVRQKQITVGRAYSADSLITQPMTPEDIMAKIREFCREDIRDRVLTQEILIYLGLLIKAEPQLFKGFLTLRVGHLILLLTSELAHEEQVTQDEAYEKLMHLSPFEVKTRLRQVLEGYAGMNQMLQQQEVLRVRAGDMGQIDWVVAEQNDWVAPSVGWHRKRQTDGALNRVPQDFYAKVWQVMQHCRGVVIGDKLERRNRLDSELLAEMTAGEKNFALKVEHLLNKIQAPEYHQVNVEALMELAAIVERNPNFYIQEYIVLDVLIGHAVRLYWLDKHPEDAHRYDEQKGQAWQSFYDTSPYVCASFIAKALKFLTESGQGVAV